MIITKSEVSRLLPDLWLDDCWLWGQLTRLLYVMDSRNSLVIDWLAMVAHLSCYQAAHLVDSLGSTFDDLLQNICLLWQQVPQTQMSSVHFLTVLFQLQVAQLPVFTCLLLSSLGEGLLTNRD